MPSNGKSEEENRRRLSSIQRQFGGRVKRKVPQQKPVFQAGPSTFVPSALRKTSRRPSYEETKIHESDAIMSTANDDGTDDLGSAVETTDAEIATQREPETERSNSIPQDDILGAQSTENLLVDEVGDEEQFGTETYRLSPAVDTAYNTPFQSRESPEIFVQSGQDASRSSSHGPAPTFYTPQPSLQSGEIFTKANSHPSRDLRGSQGSAMFPARRDSIKTLGDPQSSVRGSCNLSTSEPPRKGSKSSAVPSRDSWASAMSSAPRQSATPFWSEEPKNYRGSMPSNVPRGSMVSTALNQPLGVFGFGQASAAESRRVSRATEHSDEITYRRESAVSGFADEPESVEESWSSALQDVGRTSSYPPSRRVSRQKSHLSDIPEEPLGTRQSVKSQRSGISYRREDSINPRKKSSRFRTSKKYSRLEEEWDDERPLRRSRGRSVDLPALDETEKIFIELVSDGDVAAVQTFLAEHDYLNVNCVSYQKTSALHVAIRSGNIEMMELLLNQRGIILNDAVLVAVHAGDLNVLEALLRHIQDRHPSMEQAACSNSAEYGEDLTPLMLAAMNGNYEVVDLLLQRGHRIPDIHHPRCACKDCMQNLQDYDRLRYSKMKLNLYKAATNPSYLFQTNPDPIRRAFALTGELQTAAQIFPTFKSQYEELWTGLREFSADMIGCCRDADEVETVLRQPSGCESAGLLLYPRLQLAIDLSQKEFVAHPNTQAVLQNAWLGEETSWKTQSAWQQALAPVWRIPVLLFIFFISCCAANASIIRSYGFPIHKFISSQASYLVFLTLLYILSAEDKTGQVRGPPQSGVEVPIVIYVLGYVWSSIRLCFILGPKRFFNIGWNVYDVVMQVLFVCTFCFWLAAWADVVAHPGEEVPRRFWNAYDPTLIAEGLFALATIMAFLRLYLPLSLNYHLGPLQVSIGKMTRDIFQFVFIFFVMVLAFTCGLVHFYQPYDGMIQMDPDTKANTTQVSSFVSFPMSLKTFFWAIFGQSPIESADVVISNMEGADPGTTTINTHEFTEGVGYFCFAMFNFLATVVVLNMLVACMANTFTKVIDNVAVEWVFGRTKIYLLYMSHGELPPPFNLIPTTTDLLSFITWITKFGKKDSGMVAKFSLNHCCYMERAYDAELEEKFTHLMTELAQRYLAMKKNEDGD